VEIKNVRVNTVSPRAVLTVVNYRGSCFGAT